MTPSRLSRELRTGTSADLRRRRWVIGLSLVATAAAQAVALFQTGIVKRLPDPPLRIFDSSRVDASDYGYKRLLTPDAFMMLASYAITASLAAAGGERRATSHPVLPLLMGAKVAGDALVAVGLGREEWKENKALCAYCQVATLCSLASLALVVPEVLASIRRLRHVAA